jgi:hypothetical protein
LICFCPLSALAMLILRGLACSGGVPTTTPIATMLATDFLDRKRSHISAVSHLSAENYEGLSGYRTVRSGEETRVSLTNVWLQTLADGLVRADQVTGIDAHQTPALIGTLAPVARRHASPPTPIGSGTRGEWGVSALHRTLVQTSQHPVDAPAVLGSPSSMPSTPPASSPPPARTPPSWVRPRPIGVR